MAELDLVPEPRRDAVRDALQAAFGVRTVSDLRVLSGGVSGALIARFDNAGQPYVLRLEPERIPVAHRRRGFTCMSAAAEAGAAPRVQYADADAGVAIMDFAPSRPLADYPGGAPALVRELGGLLARVRATPPFPSLGDYPDMIAALLAALAASGRFAPGRFDAHADGLARIRAALPWDSAAMVSSHNDPNPRNLIFDGRRLWLIDWELACRNDPLVDLAIVTTDLAETPELEDALLTASLGRAPDAAVRTRLAVIRLLTRLFYGCIVLDSLAGVPDASPDLPTDTPQAFRAAIAAGRLKSGTPQVAHAFARMSLATFLRGVSAPGFGEQLKRLT